MSDVTKLPAWLDFDSDDCVIPRLLTRNAKDAPNEIFVTFESGEQWTRQRGLDVARGAANALAAAGVQFGDRVAAQLPNGPELLATWWGAATLGAAFFPINTAFKGSALERALQLCDPAVIVVDDEYGVNVDLISHIEAKRLHPRDLAGFNVSEPPIERPVELWDSQLMVMTSGTTGPSKLVEISHLYSVAYTSILIDQGCDEKDLFLIDFPLFHVASLGYVNACLHTKARLHIRRRPAIDRYWSVARDAGATCCVLMSSMVALLEAATPSAADRDHGINWVLMAPLPPDIEGFKKRFGIQRLYTSFGGTEISAPLLGLGTPNVGLGYGGHARPGWEVRIFDEHDMEVADGAAGQAVVRSQRPYMMGSGYFRNDAANAEAWRHGWFHTGDLLRKDETGAFYFVGRAKDALRRRGENISAFEVEVAVSSFAGIKEASCVAVPSDSGVEDEVKVWLVVDEQVEIDYVALLRHCVEEMPHFMVPRYFEVIDELPKSPSAKVQKYLLREKGNSSATWDREGHGLTVTRRGLESS